VDVHLDHPQISLASPCSGHLYKFATVVAEILADLATRGAIRLPIGMFSARRFGKAEETVDHGQATVAHGRHDRPQANGWPN
jgi:sarcosine oxidase